MEVRTNPEAFGVTTTNFCGEGDVTNKPLRISKSFPIVRFCNACSGVISSKILRGLMEVLICAGSVEILVENLVTLGSGVVLEELIVLKSLPTCMELVSSVAWIALRELRIFSIIVVGFSVVGVRSKVFSVYESTIFFSFLIGFLVANFKMAEFDSVVLTVLVFGISDVEVVCIAVIEFIILSIMDTGFSVVPSLTFEKDYDYL